MHNIKRHICDVRNSRLGHDIPISVNDRVILPFRECFNITKLRKNKTLAKISEFTVYTVASIAISFAMQCSVVYDSLFNAPLHSRIQKALSVGVQLCNSDNDFSLVFFLDRESKYH